MLERAFCGSDSFIFLHRYLLSVLEDEDRLGTISDQLTAFSDQLRSLQANRGSFQTMQDRPRLARSTSGPVRWTQSHLGSTQDFVRTT